MDVRRVHDEATARLEDARDLFEHRERIGQMLGHVIHRRKIEALRPVRNRRQVGLHDDHVRRGRLQRGTIEIAAERGRHMGTDALLPIPVVKEEVAAARIQPHGPRYGILLDEPLIGFPSGLAEKPPPPENIMIPSAHQCSPRFKNRLGSTADPQSECMRRDDYTRPATACP